MIDRIIGKRVILETKSDSKLFGEIIDIDKTPEGFNWIILKDKYGKEQIISDNSIIRVEVLYD